MPSLDRDEPPLVSLPLLPRAARYALWWTVAALVLVGSLVSGELSPARLVPVTHSDKVVHAASFALLGLLAGYATWGHGPSRAMKAVLLYGGLVAYGAFVEVLQATRPDRLVEAWDVAANAAGALALLGWYWVEPRLKLRPLGQTRVQR